MGIRVAFYGFDGQPPLAFDGGFEVVDQDNQPQVGLVNASELQSQPAGIPWVALVADGPPAQLLGQVVEARRSTAVDVWLLPVTSYQHEQFRKFLENLTQGS